MGVMDLQCPFQHRIEFVFFGIKPLKDLPSCKVSPHSFALHVAATL